MYLAYAHCTGIVMTGVNIILETTNTANPQMVTGVYFDLQNHISVTKNPIRNKTSAISVMFIITLQIYI